MNTIVVDSSGTAAVVDTDCAGIAHEISGSFVGARYGARSARDNESYFYGAAALIVVASLLSLVLSGDIPSIRWDALRTLKKPNAHAAQRSLLWDEWAGTTGLASLALPQTLVRVDPSDAGLPRVQEVVIGKGEALGDVWKAYAAFPDGYQEALKELTRLKEANSLSGLKDVDVKAGEGLTLQIADKDIVELKRTLKDGIVLHLVGNSLQGYQGKVIYPKISESVRVVSGAIESTLSDAARLANLPYEIVDQFVDLFGTRIDFRKDLQRGDTFALKYTSRISDVQGELPPGAIQAVSLSVGGRIYAAIRHQRSDGSFLYIDERGRPLGDYFLKYPLSFSRISSVYADSRMHPVLKIKRPHFGVDFAAPTGTPVRAVGDGVIEEVGYKGSAGKMVKISHNSTYATAYLHLNSIGSKLQVGSKVHRGQVIGTVGSTGLASGPHLHYSLYKNGKYVDPLKESLTIVTPRSERIDPKLLKITLSELGSFHSQYLMKAHVVGDSIGIRNVMKTVVARHENIRPEAALSANESGQSQAPQVKQSRESSLELILNDPRLRMRSEDEGRCNSLNVFACGR
jgi:murein DD-endopeptidase MepM/ murein hydrolase activator NlpD